MLRLYSDRAAERIIRRLDGLIRAIEARYALPAPVLQAVLYQEITQIDLLDILADLLVALNWLRLTLTGRMQRLPQRRGLLCKLDSSTGYAQIFARVGIDAINFALGRGLPVPGWLALPGGRRLSADDPRDLRDVWRRLNRDRAFNLELAALNLLAAAEEKTGRVDFASYPPEELQRIFTRYNGTSPSVSAYGRAAYAHYVRYSGISKQHRKGD